MPRLKITYKMAIILATMSFGPMLAGQLTGLFQDDSIELQKERAEQSRLIATACSSHLSTSDSSKLQVGCRELLRKVDDLRSLRILRHDGLVLYASPGHEQYWTLPVESPSTLDQVRIPLMRGSSVYAELEVAFQPVEQDIASVLARWLAVAGIGFLLNFGSFSLFLNKALSVMDPKSAVPKRVRNTLDTIVGGVVILDAGGKILLVNDSFAKYVSQPIDALTNQELTQLGWTRDENDEDWPWVYVIREQSQRAGVKIHLRTGEEQRTFMVNATPVFDAQERISGALVSFEDITLMEEQRRHLLTVLRDLETSKEQIRRQNEVLHELATRDGLTGALNRRALLEKIGAMWESRNRGDRGLVTIMMDVDHFKKLNDQHGHAAGDAVLKDVVKTVSRIVEGRALLGRFGGEEFCVVIQNATLEEGASMAEEIRAGIATDLADPYRVTASLGVSSSIHGAPNIEGQIEQADQGLYAAKHGGRNGFRVWSPELEEQAKEEEKKKAAKLAATDVEEQPISYHAVVTLNSALIAKSPSIAAHSHRVAEICATMARGVLPVGQLYTLEIAGMLHDIGELAMPDNANEFEESRALSCVSKGVQILRSAFQSKVLLGIVKYQSATVRELDAVTDETVVTGAKILAIANAYDLLTSELSDAPMSHDEAVVCLRREAGVRFCAEWVERFADSPYGWRPIAGAMEPDTLDSAALMVGYQLERVIYSFESGNLAGLKPRLESLQNLARKIDMPWIGKIIEEFKGDVERKAVADWGSLAPIVQDLVEICLSIQRAHLRMDLSRPAVVKANEGTRLLEKATVSGEAIVLD
jgi:diguanylate cyclase (GGDEF)-like protein